MIAIALGLVLFAASELPQEPAPSKTAPPPPARSARAERTDDELTRRLDAYAVEQAQKALELTRSQFTAFAPRFRKYQEMRRQHVQARNALLQQLRELTTRGRGATPDESAIAARLKALREHDERAAAEVKRAYAELDEVLDIRQQARFRVFEGAMERRKLEMMLRARAGRGRSNR
jgi:Spy/CpxP family protein refolding chaperone